ncbi:MAG: hypothetical protein HOH19_06415 [Kordiimonadaceae bacterium]|nr:hypothetical protein [Kordiimonadaceae bacterium]
MTKQHSKTKDELKKQKQDRLTQALKDNLRRRKVQAKKSNNKTSEE